MNGFTAWPVPEKELDWGGWMQVSGTSDSARLAGWLADWLAILAGWGAEGGLYCPQSKRRNGIQGVLKDS